LVRLLMTIRGGECGLRSHRRLEEALRWYGGARGDGKEGTRRLRRSRSNDRLRRETRREGGGYNVRILRRLRREARGVLKGAEKFGTELSDSVRSLVEVEERRWLSSEGCRTTQVSTRPNEGREKERTSGQQRLRRPQLRRCFLRRPRPGNILRSTVTRRYLFDDMGHSCRRRAREADCCVDGSFFGGCPGIGESGGRRRRE
jgi:hypothetical protein